LLRIGEVAHSGSTCGAVVSTYECDDKPVGSITENIWTT